jgi:predicted DNA-binding WGR domain protein
MPMMMMRRRRRTKKVTIAMVMTRRRRPMCKRYPVTQPLRLQELSMRSYGRINRAAGAQRRTFPGI